MVDLSDSTAYSVHDVEDGLRAGMFTEGEIHEGVALWRGAREAVELRHPGFLEGTKDEALRIKRVTNELIKICINDLITASQKRLQRERPKTADAVRQHERNLIGHSRALKKEVGELQRFLSERFYQHPHLQRLTKRSAEVLEALFDAVRKAPNEMPPWYRRWIEEVGLERSVCDYLAGMTDRFAAQECERLTGQAYGG